MGHPRGKFRMRIRKMRPEPITVRRRQAWGNSEKSEETVLGTIFVSLFCFKILRVSRRNGSVDEDDTPSTDPEQVQIEIGDVHTPGSIGNNRSEAVGISTAVSNDDENVYPNLIQVLESIRSSGSHEHMSSPLPGAVGEADPQSVIICGGAAAVTGSGGSSLRMPTSVSTREMEQAESTGSGDLELAASLPSSENLSSAAEQQQQTKQKKSKKCKNKNKKQSKKRQAAGKNGNKSKSSSTKEESSKIPSVKEWAKQEEKKKKAEKKQQKKELKQEKQKQKLMKKQVAKAEKQKKAQTLKEGKEIKKVEKEAEKEAAKAKKVAEKEEKAAAKAKEAATKAEAKKKEKEAKLALRMQQMLDESDKQMAADLERERMKAEERKRKQEDRVREVMNSIAKTKKIIETLQEKLERKEKKIAQLSTRRDRNQCKSIVVAFKLHYKITNYHRMIHSINRVISKLNKKVKAKQHELKELVPHLLKTEVPREIQEYDTNVCSNNTDHTQFDGTVDNDSILDILSYFDSESECSDEEDSEEEPHDDGNSHSNVQEILHKAQESLQKMDADRHKVPSIFFR